MQLSKKKIALLIDADTTNPTSIKAMIEEISMYGKLSVRRVYGNFGNQKSNEWNNVINSSSLIPRQKQIDISGEEILNTSLIIDAMDILHTKKIDAFCLVTNNSNYSNLCKRLREEGMFVLVVGKSPTLSTLKNSCDVFIYIENILLSNLNSDEKEEQKIIYPGADVELIDKAFRIAIKENEKVSISKVRNALSKINPSFDTRDIGYKNFVELFENLKSYGYVVLKSEISNKLFVRKNI